MRALAWAAWSFRYSPVLDDPVSQMNALRGPNALDEFELHVSHVQRLEHWRTAAEQHRGQVNRELVDEPGGEGLPPEVSAAHDGHNLVAGARPRLAQRALDAVGDEVVHAAIRAPLRRLVGHNERR